MDKTKFINQIVDEHTQVLYNRAYYLLSNQEEAEDIVQEVFIIAYNSMDKFSGKSSIKTWLFSILNHKISDYYRSKYRNTTKISLDNYFSEDESWKKNQLTSEWNLEEKSVFDDQEFISIFENCIESLPQKWKIPVKLYYIEEKNSEYLSQELKITTTNIWKILQRSRLQLKDCLEINWFKKNN